MSKFFFILSVVSSLALYTIFSGQFVNASSVYDSAYVSKPTLVLKRSGCTTLEFTDNEFIDLFLSSAYIDTSLQEDVENALENGFVTVSQIRLDNQSIQWPIIMYSETGSATLDWTTTTVDTDDLKIIISETLDSTSCEFEVVLGDVGSASSTNQSITNTATDTSARRIHKMYGDIDINLPVDYEGETPVISSYGVPETDTSYQTTDTLPIYSSDFPECTLVDIAENWYTTIMSFDSTNPGSDLGNFTQADKDSFNNALVNGSWSVSSWIGNTPFGNNSDEVTISWNENAGAEVTFDGGVVYYQATHRLTVSQRKAYVVGGCGFRYSMSDFSPSGLIIASDNAETEPYYRNLLIGGDVDIQYPSGYNGVTVRNSFDGSPTQGEPTRPSLEVVVNNANIDARITRTNLPESMEDCRVKFNYYISTFDGENSEVYDSKLGYDDLYQYSLQGLPDGEYLFGVEPADPFITYPIELEGVIINDTGCDEETVQELDLWYLNYQSSTMHFVIDGSSYILDTDTCEFDNETGTCAPHSVYQDCSVYSTFSGDAVTCFFNNIIAGFNSLLTSLFVPNSGVIKNSFDNLTETLKSTLGFLYYPVELVQGIFGALITASSSPQCSYTAPGTWFGGTMTLGVCSFSDNINGLYTPLINLARMFIVVGFAFMLLHKLKEVLHS